ncbi:oxaloacetate decarboxylase [Novosphingobium sp. CECT 9465]|uniref:isocitrate lyase/PEP mutase family protein n=1 Tax=Novosphingobium sp. CECT 9465 TaxID=2829794 RepID=UPI001E4F22E9|nr:isocitrate lyase/PEP mutase family protein [Novosphingobium sp. CECT 9465]CAH0495282.1 2,3-dimethylmalate lyase [Novosphingobium sp. CECT 9465]
MANSIIRQKLDRGEFFIAPGIQDMITAAIANHVGMEIVYGSGYWLTASAYGLPDAGIASYTQMLDRMATLCATSNAAVIADADTGYGGLLNVHHTVRGYEDAGVAAIQLEDQEFPKKCGHTPFKRLVSCDDMAEKIRVACDARRNADTLIIARTDARQSEGLEGALARAEQYRAAGADILFVEALTSEEEMRIACDRIKAPMMANLANGGLTPMFNAAQLQDIGYALAIFPSMTSLISAAVTEIALQQIKDGPGSPDPDGLPMFDFKQFCSLIGFEDVWAFERKWAR